MHCSELGEKNIFKMSNKAREMSLLNNLRFHSVLKSSSVNIIKNVLFDPIFVCALYFYANYNIEPNLARHAFFSCLELLLM